MMGMSIPTLIVPIVIILLALAFVLGLLWVLVWWQDEKRRAGVSAAGTGAAGAGRAATGCGSPAHAGMDPRGTPRRWCMTRN